MTISTAVAQTGTTYSGNFTVTAGFLKTVSKLRLDIAELPADDFDDL